MPERPKEVLDQVASHFRPGASLIDPDVLGRMLTGDLANFRSAPSRTFDVGLQQALRRHFNKLLPFSAGIMQGRRPELCLFGQGVELRELSDGYGSLLAVIGHLFSHGLAVQGWRADPTAVGGVALLDEIDLHLHPAWQRQVLPDLLDVFPRMQFIGTSHSALVAGSIPTNEIVVLRREGETVRILTDLPSIAGWRADQILTSLLFDLSSARDKETERMTARYARLINEHGPEAAEVRAFEAELDGRQAENPGSTRVDREALALLEATIEEQLVKEQPERRKSMLETLRILLQARP